MMAMMGMMMNAEPSCLAISPKLMSSGGSPAPELLAGIEKGGSSNFGKLASISPLDEIHISTFKIFQLTYGQFKGARTIFLADFNII